MERVRNLKSFQKLLGKAGEIQAPFIAWSEVGMPLPDEDHVPAYIDTLPNNMLFHCRCSAGSHKLIAEGVVPRKNRGKNPSTKYLEIHAEFYKRKLFSVSMFFLIRCWNNRVSFVECRRNDIGFGKVICEVPDDIFQEAQQDELEHHRRSEKFNGYRYLWGNPVIVGSFT